jgi:acetylornithine/LysW-gamma-L-lysine aminotransferase
MYEGLLRLKDKYKIVRDVRGLGLMLGIELRFDVKDILLDGLKHNILLLYSGRNVIRLLPPLIINEEIAGKALTILDTLLNREQERRGIK